MDLAFLSLSECLVCHCTDCEGPISPGHIWATCATDGACYTKVREMIRQGSMQDYFFLLWRGTNNALAFFAISVRNVASTT